MIGEILKDRPLVPKFETPQVFKTAASVIVFAARVISDNSRINEMKEVERVTEEKFE